MGRKELVLAVLSGALLPQSLPLSVLELQTHEQRPLFLPALLLPLLLLHHTPVQRVHRSLRVFTALERHVAGAQVLHLLRSVGGKEEGEGLDRAACLGKEGGDVVLGLVEGQVVDEDGGVDDLSVLVPVFAVQARVSTVLGYELGC